MGEILFLAHRIPFPPDRGDKIRSHHILKALAEIAPVHVACFSDDEGDADAEEALAEVSASYCLVERSKPLPLAGLEAVARGRPVSCTAFHSPRIARFVSETLATRPIEAIYVFSGQMGQYVPDDFAGRVIVDFVDVDSAKFEAYGREGSGPRGWIDAREGRVLRSEEARLAGRADISLFVSEAEAALFRRRLGDRCEADVRALPNGIDATAFDPEEATPAPELADFAGPKLIFTGQMDYAPNIEAAQRAMDRILPRLRQTLPDATFHVVGRNPPARLAQRHGKDGCHVWGRVADMTAWLAAADMALVPLRIGRGVQNKVLEAMAMRLPVVLSPEAATGIAAQDGEHFAIGADDEAIAAQIVALWQDRGRAKAMGEAARAFVIGEMSWLAALATLPELVRPQAPKSRRDAA